jgi:hypothetical protein
MADPVLTQAQVVAEIIRESSAKNVDPLAALGVAKAEGGWAPAPGHYDPDTHGAPGWSYGPFQLRDPGALPISSSGAQGPGYQYAWSKQGIDYAIDQIASVAAGQTGQQAISAIVTQFERPADPSHDLTTAWATYQQLQKGGVTAQPPAPANVSPLQVGANITQGAKDIAGAVTGPITSVEKAIEFLFSYRFLEIMGGLGLIGLGIVGLVRDVGGNKTFVSFVPNLPGGSSGSSSSRRSSPDAYEQGRRQGEAARARKAGRAAGERGETAAVVTAKEPPEGQQERSTRMRETSSAYGDEIPF